ncbi:hypothetical protein DFR29_104290 [Tahibacter aquaticus]|uniref:Uncharacterized protein n=1 Tax=Tahibacter aquaticus TaxID=520092 RepID=A0A4R6Z2P5_9GAMM|nr:hypothetical protein [Tahibacter aquaticus]TDR45860.1 hypothetical protein DFR29_104290 [Tahibacter aquaticus]
MATYKLPDEPRPGALSAVVADPMWPFLSSMLVGAWFGLAWFVLNSVALGSPTLKREIGLAALALGGKAVLVLLMIAALQAGWIEKGALPYVYLIAVGLMLACTYSLYLTQSRTFELFAYFGGEVKNGVVVLLVGMAVVRPYVAPLFGDGLLGLVLR